MGYFGIPFRNGVPIGLGSVASFGAQQFDPSSLFIGGTVGTFYDPSDPTTLFTTSTGTTPCAVPGSGSQVLVGLMLDKSQGAPGALGAELITPAANRDFSSNTGYWTPENGSITISGGAANFSSTTNAFALYAAVSAISASLGKYYEITYTLVSCAAGGIRFGIGANYTTSRSAPGTYTERITAGAGGFFGFYAVGTTTASVDNLSVREIPGNHAIAFNDTTARPELSARVNLLVATATLSTQNVTTQATSYTLRFAGTGNITLSGTATGSYSAGTHAITCTAGTLTLTVSGTVTTADLRPANAGALLPAYQEVVNANTYDSNGFPSYLRFDGVDDSMYTPASINFSGTDKMSVFAGVRKLSDAVYPVIAELAFDYSANNGSFALFASGNSTPRYGFYLRGSANTGYEPQTYEAPLTNVLAVSYDIGGAAKTNEVLPRINSVLNQTNPVSGADAGTGNFGTYPLFIGSRNNASLRFNGHLYSLIIAGTQLQSGSITATEQWVAGKVGITI